MKKNGILLLCLVLCSLLLSACNTKTPSPMVQSQRRFAQYVEPSREKQKGVIDLSDGKALRYDAEFGPKAIEFDFKVKSPY